MTFKIEDARECIPLYINGNLQGKDKEQFEKFLNNNDEFRTEYEEFLLIENGFRKIESSIPVDLDAVLVRVQDRIKTDIEITDKDSATCPENKPGKGALHHLFHMPRLAWWVIIAQLIIIAILISVNIQGHESSFIALNSENAAHTELLISFNNKATIKEIGELLAQNNGRIIEGPDKLGVTKIAFHGRTEDVDKLIATLHNTSIVAFVKRPR